jgi:hypothetical protein
MPTIKVSHHFDENLVVLLDLGGFCDATALHWRSLTHALKIMKFYHVPKMNNKWVS